MTGLPTPAAGRRVAVLCGSVSRAVAALDAAERWYRAQGYTVHKPVADDSRTPAEHAERWYALIEQADLVIVCTMQHDVLGMQTSREMGDALHLGKSVRLWVEQLPTRRGTCPACHRPDRALDPQGRIRFHHDGRTHAVIRCVGTGQRPDHAEERAS